MSLGHAQGTADDTRVLYALRLMEQRLSDPMPIHELAARLQLSTRHVERLFQGVVGAMPRTVYRRMRLRRAHWMLANTGHSITSIAIDTGFSDGAHFARQFKQMTGVSPSAARRDHLFPWGENVARTQSPKQANGRDAPSTTRTDGVSALTPADVSTTRLISAAQHFKGKTNAQSSLATQ